MPKGAAFASLRNASHCAAASVPNTTLSTTTAATAPQIISFLRKSWVAAGSACSSGPCESL